jgi:hypothetical protein
MTTAFVMVLMVLIYIIGVRHFVPNRHLGQSDLIAAITIFTLGTMIL